VEEEWGPSLPDTFSRGRKGERKDERGKTGGFWAFHPFD